MHAEADERVADVASSRQASMQAIHALHAALWDGMLDTMSSRHSMEWTQQGSCPVDLMHAMHMLVVNS